MTSSHDGERIDGLPDDEFGVLVENDMDERRLLWLVNEIGEKKLRASVNKYNARYPDCKPFVSLLLKWYQKTVPVAIYAPVRGPVYAVYLLVMTDGSAMKIGHSGGWHERSYAFLNGKQHLEDLFDFDRSCAATIGSSKKDAAAIETSVKHKFHAFSTVSPWERGLIPYGCGGHTEWFVQDCYQDVVSYLTSEATRFPGGEMHTLRSALQAAAVFSSSIADISQEGVIRN